MVKQSADNRKSEGSIPSLAIKLPKIPLLHKICPAKLMKKKDVPIMPPGYFELLGIIWHLDYIHVDCICA